MLSCCRITWFWFGFFFPFGCFFNGFTNTNRKREEQMTSLYVGRWSPLRMQSNSLFKELTAMWENRWLVRDSICWRCQVIWDSSSRCYSGLFRVVGPCFLQFWAAIYKKGKDFVLIKTEFKFNSSRKQLQPC